MFFQKIKKYLKNTPIWIKISYGDLYQRIRNAKTYEKKRAEFFFYKNLIERVRFNNALIIDVGANVGSKSSIFSKLSKKVLAFEPSPSMCYILKHRYKNSNVEIFNCALGRAVANLDFYQIEGNEAYNSLSEKHIETTVIERNIGDKGTIKRQTVAVKTLEEFIETYGIPVYVKIDVEGYEYEVVQGLQTAVPIISYEVNLPEFQDESIKIIDYLSTISGDAYQYNFTSDSSFLVHDFVNKNDAVAFLTSTTLRYLEVYAKLDPEKIKDLLEEKPRL